MTNDTKLALERAVKSYLWYHSGIWCQYTDDYTTDTIDQRAEPAMRRMVEEGAMSPDSINQRMRSMRSLSTQASEEVSTDQRDIITLDAECIRLAYHIPAAYPSGLTEQDLQEEFIDLTLRYNDWEEFLANYRSLAGFLERHYEATYETFKENHRAFLSAAHWHYGEMFQSDAYFDGPEYRVTGVNQQYNRNVRTCLDSSQAGLMVRVKGQITDISTTRASYYHIAWRCNAVNADGVECGHVTEVRQDDYNDDMIRPHRCASAECEAPAAVSRFSMMDAPLSKERRIRRAFIQEELVDSTDQPNVLVEFRDSISTQVEAGKVVTIIGYVRSRPVDTKSKGDRNRELYIVVTGLESNDAARDFVVEPEYREAIEHWSSETSWDDKVKVLTESYAPEIKGRDKVKHGLILQQCGGSENTYGLRSDIHIAIFGDPGTGKSIMMEYTRDMHPGTQYLTGERATRAGLIGGMGSTKGQLFGNSDSRVITPGALALTPRGAVCIIDEAQNLDCDPAELNTALERQEVAVAMSVKAKLTTKTPVIIVANPKTETAKFDPLDPHRPVVAQANMKDSTLTRMELVFFLFDEKVSEAEEERRAASIFDKMDGIDPSARSSDILPKDFMKNFFAMARLRTSVVFTEDAKMLLVRNQVAMRTSGTEDQVSQRRSASLARLAQAAAKLDFSDTVELRHADFAIATMSGAEQDRDPGALRGAIHKDARDKKAAVWDAIQLVHEQLGQNAYTVLELDAAFDTAWDSSNGSKPNFSELNRVLEALCKEDKHGKFGSLIRVKKNTFTFSMA
jgi:replicative DNA helicase Mcm